MSRSPMLERPQAETATQQSSVGKAFALVRLLGAAPLGVAELARRAGIPKSTAFRLLGILEVEGLVERTEHGFRVGMGAFELGIARSSALRKVCDAALPVLVDVHLRLGQPTHLGVMSGLDVLYLHKIVGSHGIHLPSRVGARIPVHLPALGKALLAFASEHTIAARVRHGLERRTSYSVGDAHRLTDQLDEIRSSHVAIEREEVRLGVCCVGVPILSPDGTVVASMSVASPINTFTPSTLAAVLGDAARRISESIPASMVLHDQDAQCVASAPRRGA